MVRESHPARISVVVILVVSQPRNSSCFRRDLDKQGIAIARLLPKNTFDFQT